MNLDALDTEFRPALRRMLSAGQLREYAASVDWDLELAGIMKRLDGGPALLFSAVRGYGMPVVGNLLACRENCEAAFGVDFRALRALIGRALPDPKPPRLVTAAPVQEVAHRTGIDLPSMLPALGHTAADGGNQEQKRSRGQNRGRPRPVPRRDAQHRRRHRADTRPAAPRLDNRQPAPRGLT